MHELSLMIALADMIANDAATRGIGRITEVEIEVGELSGAFPHALREAFPLATHATIIDNASLTIIEVPAVAQCQTCPSQFSPVVQGWQCPTCGKSGCLISGTELGVKSYVGEE
jgi:hydrogenase nickel incorporation protein HypA/HybF